MKKYSLLVSILLALAVVMSVCAQDVQETFTLALSGELQTMDPYASSNEEGFLITHLIYENLLKQDAEGNYIPWLAESYEIVDDQTIDFKLRQDVYFHDGSQMTAADVAYTMALAATSSFSSGQFGSIDPEAIETPNDFEVVLHLTSVDASLMSAIANTKRGIVSKNYYETASAEDIARKPMGTGPMVFEQWVTGDRIEFKANENYWGTPLSYNKLVARFISEASSRAIEVETGGVDFAMYIANADRERLADNPKVTLYADSALTTAFMAYNNSIEPFNNHTVREAMAYALNLPAIIQVVWSGQAQVADSFFPPSLLGHKSVGPHAYDPEKAKELLAEAGYPDGFSFVYTTFESSSNTKFSETVQAMWSQVGINCSIEFVDLAQFTELNNSGKLTVALMQPSASFADPAVAMPSLPSWRTVSIRHNDTHVDDLMAAAKATYDLNERAERYGELQDYLWENLYVLPIAFPVEAYATTANVSGLVFDPTLSPDLTNVVIAK